MIEKTVCINLKRRADRWQEFVKGCPMDVERFEAIDGNDVEVPREWANPSRGAGAYGCYLSHLQIWKECVEADVESVLIFEDDALFLSNFKRNFVNFWEYLPSDWGMFYLGGQHLHVEVCKPQQVNPFVYRAFNVNRAHAYAVHRRMLPTLVEHLSTPWNENDLQDHHMGRLHQTRADVYVPEFWMVGQRTSFSDITNKAASAEFWVSACRLGGHQTAHQMTL